MADSLARGLCQNSIDQKKNEILSGSVVFGNL